MNCYSLLLVLLTYLASLHPMPLPEPERVAFWENEAGVLCPSRIAFENESITQPENLLDYDENQLKELITSAQRAKLQQRPHLGTSKRAAEKTKVYCFVAPHLAEAKILWARKLMEFYENI